MSSDSRASAVTQPMVFLSHTTADERDHTLAHKLARGLRSHGVEVWIAPDSIPAGTEWEPGIVAAILNRCSHFLVILSAASAAAPWVLEEIRLAEERKDHDALFTIIPLVMGRIDDYPGHRFINRFQRLAYHDLFADQLTDALMAIGLPPGMPDLIRSYIDDKTRDFVGRGYVFADIERFLTGNPNGYFTLVGDPGSGKSAVLAEYAKRSGCAVHFNIRAQGITSTRQFLDSIVPQIVARCGLQSRTLPQDPAESGVFLTRLLQDAQQQIGPDERLVIAVDALDELDLSGHPRGTNVLYLPQSLPERVYFVMTRRRAAVPLVVHTPQFLRDLSEFADESLADVQEYLRLASLRSRLRDWIAVSGLNDDEFVSVLAGKSERNFMYLHYVLSDLERGAYSNLSADMLPTGLEGYYVDHWRRMGMADKPVPSTMIRVIYLLTEIGLPVPCHILAQFAEEDPLTVQVVLDEWRQFLQISTVDAATCFSLYHASFRDFLHRLDIMQAAGVSLQEMNARIATLLLRRSIGNV